MKTLFVPFLAVACFVQATASQALNPKDFDRPPPWSKADCPVACVVRNNDGGLIHQFQASARALKAEGRLLVIDGDCTSSCTMAADMARPNVCITKRARFRFHQTYDFDADGRFTGRGDATPFYSRDIAGWVHAHGGFPGKTERDDALLNMSASAARAFFPQCKS